ncbi:MAG: hypothetical protein EBZ18_04605 [Alphaproteobacteria bacterium]|nr:hypothetical protein [Alphaproteobacteria bacterium]
MTRTSRQRAEKHGRFAEIYAAVIYGFHGFRILERRYRTTLGEADLILRRGNLIVVAEIKYAGAGQSVDAVLPSMKQFHRIERTALLYQARHPENADAMLRLDIMVIRPWGFFRIFPNVGRSI